MDLFRYPFVALSFEARRDLLLFVVLFSQLFLIKVSGFITDTLVSSLRSWD